MIKIGNVFKVYYIIFLKNKKKKKKSCFFIGLCFNKKKNFFELINKIDGEQVIIGFDNNSPTIFKIVNLKMYIKLSYKTSKLFFKKGKSYFDDINTKDNAIQSSFDSFKYKYHFSSYFKICLMRKKKKIKRLKRKYFRTLNWLKYKKSVRNNLLAYEDDEENFIESD